MATNGLLAHAIAPETDDIPPSVEQRDEAISRLRADRV
jgi:hypothetical protein